MVVDIGMRQMRPETRAKRLYSTHGGTFSAKGVPFFRPRFNLSEQELRVPHP